VVEIKKVCFRNAKLYDPKIDSYIKRDLLVVDGVIVEEISKPFVNIDLNDKYVYTGFVDSHAHLIATGKSRHTLDITDVKTAEELKDAIKKAQKYSEIIRGRGWNQETLGFIPNRSFIDSITEIPTILVRRCGHVATVNSKMIEKFNLEELDGMDGSDISKGFLKERALDEFRKRVKLTKAEIKAFLKSGAEEFLKYGVTAVHSDDYHDSDLDDLLEILSVQQLIRIFEKLYLEDASQIKFFDKIKNYQNAFLDLKAAKVYLDGSFGARTAALIEPYADDPENKGILYMDRYQLKEYVKACEERGIQLTVHVIGDRALEEALAAFEGIKKGNPLKHRLIHVQIASNEQIEKIKELNLKVSVQPIFYPSDREMAISRLGDRRFKQAYPFKKLFEKGIGVSLSTDSPVESSNPFKNLIAAESFFDRKTAFKLYTESGRRQAFSNESGRLIPGEKADFFVTEQDIFTLPKEELSKLSVYMTVVNGEIVYARSE